MKALANFVGFQAVWFACVLGAARDAGWIGVAAALVFALGALLARVALADAIADVVERRWRARLAALDPHQVYAVRRRDRSDPRVRLGRHDRRGAGNLIPHAATILPCSNFTPPQIPV